MTKEPRKFFILVSLLSTLVFPSTSFANVAFSSGELNSSNYELNGNTYIDKNTGCSYVGSDVEITIESDEGQHYEASGQWSSSNNKTTWIITETASGKIWIPKGTTTETTNIYIQDGYVYKKVPGEWVSKDPDVVKEDMPHNGQKDTSIGTANDTAGNGNNGTNNIDPDNTTNNNGTSSDNNNSNSSDHYDQVDNITDIGIGDLNINNGIINGEWSIPGDKDYNISIIPGEDGEWVSKSYTDENTEIEFEVKAKYEGKETVLEDYWYTFTGDNLDNELISQSEAHTDFGIKPRTHKKDSFKYSLSIPGTWKIDCIYWEQLGIYKVYTVQTGPDANGNYSQTTVREKVDTQITSEAERPEFPQYVPVPLVCSDCPPVEICVNGECDCVNSANTICSDTDREEAEKQLKTYNIDPRTQLEK